MNRAVVREIGRFLVSGVINTGVTYAVYLALLSTVGYAIAYTVAYLIGIALSYLLSTRFVFRVNHTARRAVFFPVVYLVQYLFGLAVLHASVTWLGIPEAFAALVSTVLSIPLTFVLSRLVLVNDRAQRDTAP